MKALSFVSLLLLAFVLTRAPDVNANTRGVNYAFVQSTDQNVPAELSATVMIFAKTNVNLNTGFDCERCCSECKEFSIYATTFSKDLTSANVYRNDAPAAKNDLDVMKITFDREATAIQSRYEPLATHKFERSPAEGSASNINYKDKNETTINAGAKGAWVIEQLAFPLRE